MTTLRIPVRQLAWATDLHLVFVPGELVRAFCEKLARTPADAIAITGDLSDGRWLERHLLLIAETVQKPIFLLLGNHDRYHTSFADAEEQVRRVVETHPHIRRLTGREVIEFNTRTALPSPSLFDFILGAGKIHVGDATECVRICRAPGVRGPARFRLPSSPAIQ